MTSKVWLIGFLALLGAGWGLTIPLAKIAVSEGYRHFGLIFWQFAIGAALLAIISILRGRGLPLGRKQLRLYLIIALIGTLLPNAASYEAARHLPGGILAIVISLVPMFAFPLALLMRLDRFSWVRLAGLSFGMLGIAVLIGPQASLPDRAMIVFIPLAMIAPAFYGLEGNVVSKWGTFGCDPFQVLLGAAIIGALLTAPLAISAGLWISPLPPWGLPDLALVVSALIHALAYSGYVWMVGRAGAVFAAQVSYLVTLFGVLWSMLLLSETYSTWIWLALALVFAGLFLVQPRKNETALDANRPVGEDAA